MTPLERMLLGHDGSSFVLFLPLSQISFLFATQPSGQGQFYSCLILWSCVGSCGVLLLSVLLSYLSGFGESFKDLGEQCCVFVELCLEPVKALLYGVKAPVYLFFESC